VFLLSLCSDQKSRECPYEICESGCHSDKSRPRTYTSNTRTEARHLGGVLPRCRRRSLLSMVPSSVAPPREHLYPIANKRILLRGRYSRTLFLFVSLHVCFELHSDIPKRTPPTNLLSAKGIETQSRRLLLRDRRPADSILSNQFPELAQRLCMGLVSKYGPFLRNYINCYVVWTNSREFPTLSTGYLRSKNLRSTSTLAAFDIDRTSVLSLSPLIRLWVVTLA
jgi:hypothetical protein